MDGIFPQFVLLLYNIGIITGTERNILFSFGKKG